MELLLGLERLHKDPRLAQKWGSCGLVCNQASVTKRFIPSWQICFDIFGKNRLKCFFGPQHGFVATVQHNMIETGHAVHKATGLPIYSLYSECREPDAKMLESFDTLIVDLPITGCRIYTYKYTMAACLRAAKKFQKKIVVLDRPNPLGGVDVEGPVLEQGAKSFVGEFELPVRHALTMAEAALLFNQQIGADLEVVKMEHYDAKLLWHDLNIPWVITSPNMPTLDTVAVFCGGVLFEGTNMSEGRGTTLPFQFIGAPFIKDGAEWIDLTQKLLKRDLKESGYFLRATEFLPVTQKWQGQNCHGVQIHIVDRHKIKPFYLGLALLRAAYELAPKQFQFIDLPYEYEYKILPINIILGRLEANQYLTASKFDIDGAFWHHEIASYLSKVQPILLYDRRLKENW